MRFPCFFLAVFLLAAPAAGRDIFVDNMGGNDTFTGMQRRCSADRSGPVRTIAKALRLAQSGDRIILAKNDEPYRESITLSGARHSGFMDVPFTIEGEGVVLEGAAPVPKGAWEHYKKAVFRFRPPRLHHQQLFIDNVPAVRVCGDPLSASPPKLEKLEWCLHGGYIYFCVEPTTLPDDYNLTHSSLETGITLKNVEKVGIIGLTVQGFQLDGINLHNSAKKVYLGGVTVRGNGRNGITVGGACQVEIDGSTIGNNGRAQILTLPISETAIANSQLFSNTAPGRVNRGGRFFLNGKQVEGNVDDEKYTGEATGQTDKKPDEEGGEPPAAGPGEGMPPADGTAGPSPKSPEGKPLY